MKKTYIKIFFSITVFAFILLTGIINSPKVYASATTTVYLEVGESYKQTVSSNNPVFDAYGEADEMICSATWNSSDTSKRTYFTIKAKAQGTATFYVCKNGKTANDYRVRTVKVYVYNKATSNTLNVTNSTSSTNGSKINVPIYLYNTQKSYCSLTQTYSFPTSVVGDSSGKAKAYTTSFKSSNTNIATVTNTGTITAVSQGTATITATRSWTTSAGNVKTISRSIYVYCKKLPSITVYNGTTAVSNLRITMADKPILDYKISNMQSTDTVSSVSCTSADINKFAVSSINGSYMITPKNVTNGTAVNLIFKIVINSEIKMHNGEAAATFTKSIPLIIDKDSNIYVSGVTFSKGTVNIVKGESYNNQVTVLPANATNKNIIYKSSNSNVVTVDNNGLITGVGCGSATITATSQQVPGCGDTYTVFIKEKDTEITLIENTGNGLKLKWKEIKDASCYWIYRCTEKNGSYSKIKTSSGTTYTDETGKYGTRYYYKIITVPKEGTTYISDYSNIVSENKQLVVPKIKSVNKVYEQYQIKLTESVNCDGYVIYNGKSDRKAIAVTSSLTATVAFTDGTCYLSVRAYKLVDNKKIYSDYSEVVHVEISSGKATIKKNYEPKKTKIKKIIKKKKSIKIKLKKIKKATGYIVKYSTSKKFKNAKNKKVKKTSFIIKKLKSRKIYYIRVRTYRIVNGKKYYSAYSKTKRIKVK